MAQYNPLLLAPFLEKYQNVVINPHKFQMNIFCYKVEIPCTTLWVWMINCNINIMLFKNKYVQKIVNRCVDQAWMMRY